LPSSWRATLDRLLHVLAGTKGPAGTGEHGDLELVAVPKLTPRFGQTGAQLLTESIESLWSVHPNHHHLTPTLRFDNRHNLTSSMGISQILSCFRPAEMRRRIIESREVIGKAR
jgi:hypothetical protein